VKVKKYKICIFAYSFKHKKTYDFINILSKANCLDIVIANPRENLKIKSNWKPKNKKKTNTKYSKAKDLCLKRDIKYFELQHKNSLKIKSMINKYKINLGIISGARILDQKIIKLFKYGIINFHPGKIPETSGLDSFFWTVNKQIYPCVTTHFIDKNIDKGKIIFQKKVEVFKKDNFYTLTNRIYKEQINLLKKIIHKIKNNKIFLAKSILNYTKNYQLSTNEKKYIYYDKFQNWKKKIIK
jgi:methionyl-tRNA formyltransferase